MRTINLQKIIEDNGLDEQEVAILLFPTNAYPKLALKRLTSGAAVMDANQISRLASFSGLTISQLYGIQGWDYTVEDTETGIFTLIAENYTAKLDTSTWKTKIFDNDSLFHDEVIHSESAPLSEYISKLNTIISKHKSNE